jgi:O-antigen ligase
MLGRIVLWDSRKVISSCISLTAIATGLVFSIGLGLGVLLSKVLSVLITPSVTKVVSSLPSFAIWGCFIGILLMTLILILRQYELAATVILAISLYADWYLGLTFVAPILTLILLVIFFLGRSPQYPWAAPRPLWLWALFLVWTLLETNRAPNFLYGAEYYSDNIFTALVMLWLGIVIARDTAHIRKLFQAISVFGVLIAIHTIIEATTGIVLLESSRNAAQAVSTQYLGPSARAIHRAESFFGNSNSDGAFLAIVFFAPLALFTLKSSFVWKLVSFCEMLIILTALLFTYSTGSWTAVLVSCIVFTALAGRVRYYIQNFFLLFAAGVVGIVGFPAQLSILFGHATDPGELELRTAVWLSAIRVIEAFPLIGLGIGRDVYLDRYQPYRVFGEYQLVNHPHNSFLEFAALGGLPVGIMFIALLSVTLWLAFRNWQQIDVDNRPLLAGGIATAISLSWFSLSDAGWTVAPLLAISWLLLGAVSSPLFLKKSIMPAQTKAFVEPDNACHVQVEASWMDEAKQGA